ncbi:ComEC/Rec2 family competence protein [Halorhodospira halophila]|uniref:ComEC/Rec2 family competence protein n=1 Tax=Halorhodospira halophila TaxID=1053 RepID=UPI00164FEBD6|nr:ComEC/Rec2 family competence protein [Halorhodospira halophila]
MSVLREPPGAFSVAAVAASGVVWGLLAPRGWRWPAAGLLGCAWALLSACWLLAHELAPSHDGTDACLEGQVVSVPEIESHRARFEFRPDGVLDGELLEPLPRRIRVDWYGATEEPAPGERWQLCLRLRAPDGFLNPEGFDYQRWLFQRRIGATAYVREAEQAERLSGGWRIDSVRTRIADAMAERLGDSRYLGLVQGLGVAVRDRIGDDQWEVLSVTGTAHLLAISGLHIGLVAGLAGTLAGGLWRVVPSLVRRVPALIAGTLAGALAAAGYAALAGFTLPTQRALLMVLVFAGALLLRRPLSPWHSLAVAAAAVLALDPWAPLGAGFWLSFGAVAIILAATTGRPMQRGPLPWLRIQVLVGVGMLPATAVWFGHLPLLSPLANLVAVPWVSVSVVPLILTGVALQPVVPEWSGGLWQGADAALGVLMRVLSALAEFLGAVEVPTPSVGAVALAAVGVALVLAPRAVPGRWLAGPLLALLLLGPGSSGGGPSGRVVVFDTGGGLTALACDGRQAVVYGGGPGGGLDAASVAVEPFLEARGLTLKAWLVPREQAPWDGAVAEARQRWDDAEWRGAGQDTTAEATEWSLGRLTLQETPLGDEEWGLDVEGEAGTVSLRPDLENDTKGLVVGAAGCDEDRQACSAAVELKDGRLLRSDEQGALTLIEDGDAWRVDSELQRRGRVYHQASPAALAPGML